MSCLFLIEEAIRQIVSPRAVMALEELGVDSILGAEFRSVIARLRHQVAPAYLPIATFEGGVLAIHVRCDCELIMCPVVHIGTGSRTPEFVCAEFRSLPQGLWLWLAAYFRTRERELRLPMDALAREIVGAKPISDVLWEIHRQAPEGQPTRWSNGASEATRLAYVEARVGHPLLGLEAMDSDDSAVALDRLTGHIYVTRNPTPQVFSALVACCVALGRPVPRREAELLLSSEAWLGGERAFRARWAPIESGLAEWSMVLKTVLAQGLLTSDTPFSRLNGHPETYSGEDVHGPGRLRAIGRELGALLGPQAEVAQLRNAASTSLYVKGYGPSDCAVIADFCEQAFPDSIAGVLALAYGEVDPREA